MKKIALLALMGVTAAHAAVTFTYGKGPNYSCSNYCTGFATSDPAYKVDYVNVKFSGYGLYQVVMSVNSVSFSGLVEDPTTLNQLRHINDDGTSQTILASADFTRKTTCTHSGRGQHCTTWYFTTDGGVMLESAFLSANGDPTIRNR